MRGICALLLAVLACPLAAAPVDGRFDPLFGSWQPGPREVPLTPAQARDLLVLAIRQNWNVFDLLNEAGLYLKARGLRFSVSGDILRSQTAAFIFGDRRVDAFLPLPLVSSLSVGARLGGDTDVEILLAKPYSQFLELGTFALQTGYGFRDVREKALDGAFGVTVKNGLLSWKLQRIARVPDPTGHQDPHFIAIYLELFFRPKQWQIDPIIARPTPVTKS